MTSITVSASQTTTYTVPQTMRKEGVLSSTAYKPSSSWRKFIPRSKLRSQTDPTMTAIPAMETTTKAPTVLKPTPLPEDYEARIEEFLHFLDSFESETEATDDITAEQ